MKNGQTPMRFLLATLISFTLFRTPAWGQVTWYEENFSESSLPHEWAATGLPWSVSKGTLESADSSGERFLISPFYAYATVPYTIEVHLKGKAPGVSFARDDPHARSFSQLIRLSQGKIISGYFAGGNAFVRTSSFPASPLPNAWNTLLLEIHPREGTCKIFLNQKEVGTESKLLFRSGYIGLYASSGPVSFEDLKVFGDSKPRHPAPPRRHSVVDFSHVRFIRAGKGNITLYDPERQAFLALDLNGRLLKAQSVRGSFPTGGEITRLGKHFVLQGDSLLVEDRETGETGTVRDGLVAPVDFTVDGDTTLYVADPGARAILHFTPQGRLLERFRASQLGGFRGPLGVDLLGHEELAVADYDRIVIIGKEFSEQVPKVTYPSAGSAQIEWPSGGPPSLTVRLASGDTPWSAVSRRAEKTDGDYRITLTGLAPGCQYAFTLQPILSTLPPSKGESRVYHFTTPAAQ